MTDPRYRSFGKRSGLCLLLHGLATLCCQAVGAAELESSDKEISAVVDHYIAQRLQHDGVQPATLLNDENTIRRLSLDLAGRIPTWAEVRAYMGSGDADKRVKLVDRLLASPGYVYHQSNELHDMLIASIGDDNAYRKYLREAVRENQSWERMFRDMLLSNGTDEKSKPASAFLVKRVKDLDTLTNDVSRLFFGVSINCAKCHDHPLVADWEQRHYYGFQSFFQRTYLTKKNTLAEKYSGRIKFKTTEGKELEAQFMFLTGSVVEEPHVEKTKEQLKAEDEEVKRQMKDAKAPPPKPVAFSPRAQLVEHALKENETHFFSNAIVNRIWARLLGRGLVHPLDQMHSENPASHPELLAWMARDLRSHSYDLRRLIRGIVLSDAYLRSSRWPSAERPEPELFAVGRSRVLSPRQFALSMIIATRNPEQLPADMPADKWSKQRDQFENQSQGLAGQLELPTEHFQVSVDEALYLSNNKQVQDDYLRVAGDRLLGHLKSISNPSDAVTAAYWSVLSRGPADEELKACLEYLTRREDRLEAGLQQVVWALITSPEMRFNY
ncbi:MAG: DUF1549 domain-containing protein [Planctomycetaceae bacterium]